MLKAFEPFKSNMVVFSNLADANARGGGARQHDAGLPLRQIDFQNDGQRHSSGRHLRPSGRQKIGDATRFPSLELGCDFGQQDGFCDTGYSCVYQTNISWRSETTPAAKEVNPRVVFDRLFAGGSATETSIVQQQREVMNLSILDLVREQATEITRTVSAADRRRMDEYLTSIRDIERGHSGSAEQHSGRCCPRHGAHTRSDAISRALPPHGRYARAGLANRYDAQLQRW